MLATGFLVVHDTVGSGQDDETKLSGWQQVCNPLFHVRQLDIEPRADDTTLVETTIKLDDNLSGAVIIHNLKLVNVAMLLHHLEEFDGDLGGGTDEDLTLALALGIIDALESIVQHAYTDHIY